MNFVGGGRAATPLLTYEGGGRARAPRPIVSQAMGTRAPVATPLDDAIVIATLGLNLHVGSEVERKVGL